MKHPSYTAKIAPDKIAYEMAGSGETLSFAQLDSRSNQAAHGFRTLGVGPGENIALLFENCLDFVVLTWAAQRSGLFYTAKSCHLTAEEVNYIVGDCAAKVLVVSAKYAGFLPAIQTACPDLRIFVSWAGDDAERDWNAFARFMPTAPVSDEMAALICCIPPARRGAQKVWCANLPNGPSTQ